jgi:hypothetical protein
VEVGRTPAMQCEGLDRNIFNLDFHILYTKHSCCFGVMDFSVRTIAYSWKFGFTLKYVVPVYVTYCLKWYGSIHEN